MSYALAKAAPLKAEIRLAEAVSLFEADLSTEQKTTFRSHRSQLCKSPPDIHDVMRLTAEIDRHTSGKLGGGRCFGPRLTNVLQAVQQFAALGDIIIGGAQNIIASGVWTLSIVNFSSCLEQLSTILMTVGRSAPRYERMGLLYPRSKILQSHLAEYFIVVVRLCHQMLKLTRKPILKQLVSINDSDMKTYQSELDGWGNSIKEEVSLLMGQNIEEQSSRLKALSRFSESESRRQRLKAHVRVLNSCSTYDYQTTWKEIRKVGNATLFNETPAYQDWKAGADSCTLVCTGKLGSGKSVLLANIVDDLHLHVQNAKCPVAYFFCRHDISESLKARTVICSLARQFLQPIPDLTMVEQLIDKTASVLDFKGILKVLQRALPPDFKALEADNALRLDSEEFAKHSTIAIPEDNPDIGGFISAELERRIKSGKLTIGNPMLILEIEDALLQGAQGMFLWVALQIESLCAAKTDEAIRQALADLPKDLPETFSRILQRSGESGKRYQMRTFELVTVAHRPLTTEELRESLSVVTGDAVWNPARLLNDVYSALACCGGLITVDEEALTVRLVHHSVKQFLLGGFKMSTGTIFTIESANRTMGDVIVTYLNYGVFETELSTTVVQQLLTGEAPSGIIRSTDAPKIVRNLALKLLQSRRQPNYNIGKVLADASKRVKSRSVDQFQFYSYAKSCWLQHARYISEHEPVMYNLLLELLKRETVDMNTWDDKGRTLLFWAAEKEHDAIVKLLVENGADLDTKDTFGQTLLWRAVRNAREAVIKLLVEMGADLESKDNYGQTPLSIAARKGHEAVVKLLLEKGANVESESNDGWTPLLHAADNGYEAVVKLLLEKGANVESESGGWTPLLSAADNGHQAVVKLLLEKGANVESESGVWMPLFNAAREGHEAVIKLLFEKGANIDSKSNGDWMPLLRAADNGHEAVVKLLLEKGVNMESNDNNGRTPLSRAVGKGHEAVVKLLLENGANIESRSKDGRTPLSWAVGDGHEAVIKLLLEKGANMESDDSYGRTPLSWAAGEGHEAVVKLLLKNGANVESSSSDGRTLLSWAAAEGHETVVKLLLEKGANMESADNNGRTPLIVDEDSGGWVVTLSSNEVLGYVVATDHFGGGYIVPFENTFHDIERRLGLRWVELPSPDDIAIANRAVKKWRSGAKPDVEAMS
ncbi:hypothetical protein DL770_008092 [Monosporascus sp. CRB-9-2]|nr:hypothetical protein DL770_008092 [Monosporascus sp. CRB-9-2]